MRICHFFRDSSGLLAFPVRLIGFDERSFRIELNCTHSLPIAHTVFHSKLYVQILRNFIRINSPYHASAVRKCTGASRRGAGTGLFRATTDY